MDKTKMKEALDCAYELEALMEMAANRDPLPERIADLIDVRSSELRRLIEAALGKEDCSVPETDYTKATEADDERIYESTIEEEEEDSLSDEDESEDSGEDEEQNYGYGDDDPEEEEKITSPSKMEYSGYARKDLRRYFSINDKFRFRRELFSNNQEEFADAINLVEAMHSIEEAEEYFYDDLNWDRENEEVQQFMEILSEYFKK